MFDTSHLYLFFSVKQDTRTCRHALCAEGSPLSILSDNWLPGSNLPLRLADEAIMGTGTDG